MVNRAFVAVVNSHEGLGAVAGNSQPTTTKIELGAGQPATTPKASGMVPTRSEVKVSETTVTPAFVEKSESKSTKTAYGKDIPVAVPYSYTWRVYSTPEAVKAANLWPSDKAIVKLVAAKEKAAARNKAYNEALAAAGYEKPSIKNDDQMKLEKFAEILVLSGYTEEAAREKASADLHIEWADDSDE